jgi:hypothetical protein
MRGIGNSVATDLYYSAKLQQLPTSMAEIDWAPASNVITLIRIRLCMSKSNPAVYTRLVSVELWKWGP